MYLTIFCPVTDKPYVFDDYIACLENLEIPNKQRVQLVVCDLTKSLRVKTVFDKLGAQFGDYKHITFDQATLIRPASKEGIIKHYKVAETFDYASQFCTGDLIFIIEDDILFPSYTLVQLLNDLHQLNKCEFKCHSVVPTLHDRTGEHLYLWDTPTAIITNEKHKGLQRIAASATGCMLTYGCFFRTVKRIHLLNGVFPFDVGPDTAYSLWLKQTYDLDLYVDWNIKTKHVDHNSAGGAVSINTEVPTWSGNVVLWNAEREKLTDLTTPLLLLHDKLEYKDVDYHSNRFPNSFLVWNIPDFLKRVDSILQITSIPETIDRHNKLTGTPYRRDRLRPWFSDKQALVHDIVTLLCTQDPLFKREGKAWGVYTEFNWKYWMRTAFYLLSHFQIVILADSTELEELAETLPVKFIL